MKINIYLIFKCTYPISVYSADVRVQCDESIYQFVCLFIGLNGFNAISHHLSSHNTHVANGVQQTHKVINEWPEHCWKCFQLIRFIFLSPLLLFIENNYSIEIYGWLRAWRLSVCVCVQQSKYFETRMRIKCALNCGTLIFRGFVWSIFFFFKFRERIW